MKRLISALLVFLMLISLVPTTVFAEDVEEYVDSVYAYYQATVYSDGFQSACGTSSSSYANNYFTLMRDDAGIMAAITAWEALHIATEPSYSMQSGLISKKDMYKLVIFDLLDVNNSVDSVSNQQADYVFEIASKILDSSDIDISELESFEVTAEYLDVLENSAKAAKMFDVLSIGSKIADASINLYDAVNAYASYQAIANMKNGTKEILTALSELPSGSLGDYFDDNDINEIKAAASESISYFDDAYNNVLERISNGTEPYSAAVIETALGLAMNLAWDYIAAAIPGGAAIMATAKGIRILSNAVFELDEQNRAYYQLEADVAFENAIRYIMTDAANDYRNDKSLDKAVYYMQTVNMYKNVVLLGFDYSANLLEIQANAPATKFFDWLTGNYAECINLINDINKFKSEKIQTYSNYEERVSGIYRELYCPDYDNVLNGFNNQVLVEVESIALNQVKEINVGDTGYIGNYIDVIKYPENANVLFVERYESINEDVIKIDEYNHIEVLLPGECTIVCSDLSGIENSITVTVGEESLQTNGIDVVISGSCGENVNYTLYEDGTMIIFGNGDMTNYFGGWIPESSVEEVDPPWNNYKSEIKKIIIKEGVNSVGDGAFTSCENLVSATISSTVDYIGFGSFCDCDYLTNVFVLGEYVIVNNSAFSNCGNLKNISIKGTIVPNQYSFSGCESLINIDFYKFEHFDYGMVFESCGFKDIILPNTITSSGFCTFQNCKNLVSVTIPNTVKSIDYCSFYGCSKLTDVYFMGTEEQWKQICIVEGNDCILDAKIHYCPLENETTIATESEIEEVMTGIDENGFTYDGANGELMIVDYLGSCTDLVIPSKIEGWPVTSIRKYAFSSVDFTSISIPDSIETIGEYAFSNCASLKDVYYSGDKDQWDEISIAEGNDLLLNATIYYNGEKPTLPTDPVETTACEPTTTVAITTAVEENTTEINEMTTAPITTVVSDPVETTQAIEITTAPTKTYHVAGSEGLCGVHWDVSQNEMSYDGDGTWSIVFTNIAMGTHQFLIIEDGVWGSFTYNLEGGGYNLANALITVEEDNATVIIGFDGEKAIIESVTYGGEIVTDPTEVTTMAPELPSADLAFSGSSLTLQDNLCINFKANESLFTEVGYENPYVIFELNGEQYTVSDYEAVSGKYVFNFADISPKNMNDTVKATLYATFDGVEYTSETREYSVATYCYNMLSKYSTDDYAELRTLLVDLLNYGAMTQVYEGYNTDELVNAKLTEEQKAWGTSDAPVYKTVQNLSYKTIESPTVSWMGGGLNLEDSVTMRFKISAESIDNLTVKAETEESIWTIPAEEFEMTTGGYYVFFDGLDASQMSESVYLTVYSGDTPVSNTICYSIESYAYSKQSSADANLVNLLAAMMKYGNSANAYVN